MDSVTQAVLGAAVGEAVLGRRIGNKALLIGALCGTLPDLDVFVPLGDAVKDFTYHRAATHSLFVLAILTPLIVWFIQRLSATTRDHQRALYVAVYAVFITHVLLDSLTAYGTQIFWPIDNTPIIWSTIFIIDPLYTLPLLIGVIAALVMTRQTARGHRISQAGLVLSSLYLVWTIGAKLYVQTQVESTLQASGISYDKLFVTPTPFNTVLWRAVVMDDTGYYEGFYHVLSQAEALTLQHHPSDKDLLQGMADNWHVQRLQWFTRGFYAVNRLGDAIILSDLRMGVEPSYVFRFQVGEIGNPHGVAVPPRLLTIERDLSQLRVLLKRALQPK